MPIIYRCKKCGYILSVFSNIRQTYQGAPTPTQLIKRFRGRCPRCGHVLSTPSLDDIVIQIRKRGEIYEKAE